MHSFIIPLVKVDEERRLIIGRAAQSVPDKSGEIMDYVSAKPAFESWSKSFEEATGGMSKGNLRVMHGKAVAGKITDISFNDVDEAVDIVAKVVDDNEWKKVIEGVYTGFSIGGSYSKKWKDGELTRYTPKVAEISLVDSPCIPTARFFDLQKADGTVEQREFKAPEPKTFAALAKHTDAQKAKIKTVMREFEAGNLHSSSGDKVTNRNQAMAIALSEADREAKKFQTFGELRKDGRKGRDGDGDGKKDEGKRLDRGSVGAPDRLGNRYDAAAFRVKPSERGRLEARRRELEDFGVHEGLGFVVERKPSKMERQGNATGAGVGAALGLAAHRGGRSAAALMRTGRNALFGAAFGTIAGGAIGRYTNYRVHGGSERSIVLDRDAFKYPPDPTNPRDPRNKLQRAMTFGDLAKAAREPRDGDGDGIISEGKKDERRVGDSALYAAQVAGAGVAAAIGGSIGQRAGEWAAKPAARKLGRKVEAVTRLSANRVASRNKSTWMPYANVATGLFTRLSSREGKLANIATRAAVTAGGTGAGLLAGAFYGDGVGDKAARMLLGREDAREREVSWGGVALGGIAGAAGELMGSGKRSVRHKPIRRIGRGLAFATAGAIGGEIIGNAVDARLNFSRAVTFGDLAKNTKKERDGDGDGYVGDGTPQQRKVGTFEGVAGAVFGGKAALMAARKGTGDKRLRTAAALAGAAAGFTAGDALHNATGGASGPAVGAALAARSLNRRMERVQTRINRVKTRFGRGGTPVTGASERAYIAAAFTGAVGGSLFNAIFPADVNKAVTFGDLAKANPYRDERGRFTSRERAAFIVGAGAGAAGAAVIAVAANKAQKRAALREASSRASSAAAQALDEVAGNFKGGKAKADIKARAEQLRQASEKMSAKAGPSTTDVIVNGTKKALKSVASWAAKDPKRGVGIAIAVSMGIGALLDEAVGMITGDVAYGPVKTVDAAGNVQMKLARTDKTTGEVSTIAEQSYSIRDAINSLLDPVVSDVAGVRMTSTAGPAAPAQSGAPSGGPAAAPFTNSAGRTIYPAGTPIRRQTDRWRDAPAGDVASWLSNPGDWEEQDLRQIGPILQSRRPTFSPAQRGSIDERWNKIVLEVRSRERQGTSSPGQDGRAGRDGDGDGVKDEKQRRSSVNPMDHLSRSDSVYNAISRTNQFKMSQENREEFLKDFVNEANLLIPQERIKEARAKGDDDGADLMSEKNMAYKEVWDRITKDIRDRRYLNNPDRLDLAINDIADSQLLNFKQKVELIMHAESGGDRKLIATPDRAFRTVDGYVDDENNLYRYQDDDAFMADARRILMLPIDRDRQDSLMRTASKWRGEAVRLRSSKGVPVEDDFPEADSPARLSPAEAAARRAAFEDIRNANKAVTFGDLTKVAPQPVTFATLLEKGFGGGPRAPFEENKHERYPKGHPLGGKFRPKNTTRNEAAQSFGAGSAGQAAIEGVKRIATRVGPMRYAIAGARIAAPVAASIGGAAAGDRVARFAGYKPPKSTRRSTAEEVARGVGSIVGGLAGGAAGVLAGGGVASFVTGVAGAGAGSVAGEEVFGRAARFFVERYGTKKVGQRAASGAQGALVGAATGAAIGLATRGRRAPRLKTLGPPKQPRIRAPRSPKALAVSGAALGAGVGVSRD